MDKKSSKEGIIKEIREIFSGQPSPKEIKKAKKLAMGKNIKLGILRRKFCKKCLSFFNLKNHEIRIKKPFKVVKCKECGNISRYKMTLNAQTRN